jgi:hypothetical protein
MKSHYCLAGGAFITLSAFDNSFTEIVDFVDLTALHGTRVPSANVTNSLFRSSGVASFS